MRYCFPNFSNRKDHVEVPIEKEFTRLNELECLGQWPKTFLFFTSTPRKFYSEGNLGKASV